MTENDERQAQDRPAGGAEKDLPETIPDGDLPYQPEDADEADEFAAEQAQLRQPEGPDAP